MDAFYASVEQLDNPNYKGKPVVVGGTSNRSVVSAASYEARKFGVHSAMPMYQAKQKCPDAVVLPTRMARYKEVSKKVISLLKTFSPLVEQVSIDEAYVDITGCDRLHGPPVEIAHKIKKQIWEEVNLKCSVGIAPNKMLAKIASDLDKPDGLYIIEPDKAHDFMVGLPVHKIPGVGKKTWKKLEKMGIKTLGDTKNIPEKTILEKLGKFGHTLLDISSGLSRSSVAPVREHKSVSSETTFDRDTNDLKRIKEYLLIQSEEVGRELRKKNVKAKTIQIKIKESDFRLRTRSRTLTVPTQSSDIIYKTAADLLDNFKASKKIRLIGVGAAGFVPLSSPIQLDLFENIKKKDNRWETVDKTVDKISKKFGKDVVKRATLCDKKDGPAKT